MDVRIKTNRTKTEPDHRLVLKAKEIVNFVYPRFKYIKGNFKIVKWTGKNGLQLHFRYDGTNAVGERQISVGFEEPGYGVTDTYYTINGLRDRVAGTCSD